MFNDTTESTDSRPADPPATGEVDSRIREYGYTDHVADFFTSGISRLFGEDPPPTDADAVATAVEMTLPVSLPEVELTVVSSPRRSLPSPPTTPTSTYSSYTSIFSTISPSENSTRESVGQMLLGGAAAPGDGNGDDDDDDDSSDSSDIETVEVKPKKRSRITRIVVAKTDVASSIRARSFASWSYDVIQVVSSMADVVLDITVAIEFYRSGFYGLFIAQAVVFAFANLTYAFLFTATWGRELTSAKRKTLVFLCVMPVAQLLPLFTYVESFHLLKVDKMIRKVGLSPTMPYVHSNSALGLNDADGAPDPAPDSVFELLRRKYQAHAGMIAESVVEATPSSVVQLAAIFLSPELGLSPVNISSIMLSTFVIASKGYLLSYSIYAATFAFNCFCIAFDVFSFFAVATWLMHAFLTAPLGPTELEWAMASLIVVGGGLIGVAGFAVMWFANFDDHAKFRLKKMNLWDGSLEIKSNFIFETYVVRGVAWIVGVIPVTVLAMGAKLSLFPLLVFKSMDPDQALYPTFYRSVWRFLGFAATNADRERRKKVINAFFNTARQDHYEQLTLGNIVSSLSKADASTHVARWAETVGRVVPMHIQRLRRSAEAQAKARERDQQRARELQLNSTTVTITPDTEAQMSDAVLAYYLSLQASMQDAEAAAKSQQSCLGGCMAGIAKRSRLIRILQRRHKDMAVSLRERSVIWPFMYPRVGCGTTGSACAHAVPLALQNTRLRRGGMLQRSEIEALPGVIGRIRAHGWKLGSLYALGLVAMLMSWLLCSICVLVLMLGGAAALFFPFVEMTLYGMAAESTEDWSAIAIPVAFTACTALCLLPVLVLAPFVARYQLPLLDLAPLHGLHPVVYTHPSVIMNELIMRNREVKEANEVKKFVNIAICFDALCIVSEFAREKPRQGGRALVPYEPAHLQLLELLPFRRNVDFIDTGANKDDNANDTGGIWISP